ncbi:hypothetical protein VP01_217g6 [Puccinia sorghi]|uniref:MHD domain-containing protein n=1 Tax=Puccinia sorghi TaxID=27349 RepID=A0A0L6VB79_9BASI|nr:hypothetical protein VP01_217g6 [Puccinia sorghi]
MTMEQQLSTELYSNTLMAYYSLSERLRQAKNLNEELSEHFKERGLIEDQYIKSLTKLAKKPINSSLASSPPLNPQSAQFRYDDDLDDAQQETHELVRNILQEEVTQSISSHQNYQSELQSQVETALRKPFGANESQLKAADEQLSLLVKSYEDAEHKLSRSTQKLNSCSNLRKIPSLQTRQNEDQHAFNQAKQAWAEHAPQAFKAYQSIDHQRLLYLFETLTKFETIQADHNRQLMEISERSTISLLAFDIRENMQRFALINGSISDPTTRSTIPPTTPTAEQQQIDSQHPPTSTPAPNNSHRPTTDHPQPPIHSPSPRPETGVHPDQPPISPELPTGPSESLADRSSDLEEQTRPSAPSLSDQPSTSALPSSSSQALQTGARNYDPNHPEIPKLDAPNISVPIRSSPSLPANNKSQNGLPPRNLYVQRHPSIDSIPNGLDRPRPSAEITRPQKSNVPTRHFKAPSTGQSITEKLFSRARLTNMLSRNGSHQSQSNLKQLKSRRLSQTNLSLSQSPELSSSTPRHESPQPTERSRHRRSSSVADTDSSWHLHASLGHQSSAHLPVASAEGGSRTGWGPSRLGQFLPSPRPLLKKKMSHSNRRWMPSSSSSPAIRNLSPAAELPVEPARVDADGFTIPPDRRDCAPWDQDYQTETLTTEDRTESSINPKLNSSTTNVTGAGQDQSRSRDRSGSASTTAGLGGGIHQFAIKPSATVMEDQHDNEADRQAAIQRVQDTLASSVGPSAGLVRGTRRSNAALRGRRGDGRWATMYDDSPALPIAIAASLVRSGTISGGSTTSNRPPLHFSPPPTVKPSIDQHSPIERLPSPTYVSRSLTDTGMDQSSSVNLSHPYPSSPKSLAAPFSQASSALPGPHQDHQASRCDSITSAISNSNLASYGFLNLAPASLNHDNPSTTATGSTNPFLNMSMSSALSPTSFNRSTSSTSPPITLDHPASAAATLTEETPKVIAPKKEYGDHLLSVYEKLNVLMHQGVVIKLLIIGEVTISRRTVSRILDSSGERPESLSLSIGGLDVLEKVIYPHDLLSPREWESAGDQGPEKRKEYRLDVARVSALFGSGTGQAVEDKEVEEQEEMCVLKYRVYLDPKTASEGSAGRHVPLIVVPRWRCREDKTELVVGYRESEAFRAFQSGLDGQDSDDSDYYAQARLHDVRVKTCIFNPALQPAHPLAKAVQDHQSLPSATFHSSENSLEWTLAANKGDQEEGLRLAGLQGKLICRFLHPNPPTQDTEVEKDKDRQALLDASCGPVTLHWSLLGSQTLSGLRLFLPHSFSSPNPVHVINVCSTFLCR